MELRIDAISAMRWPVASGFTRRYFFPLEFSLTAARIISLKADSSILSDFFISIRLREVPPPTLRKAQLSGTFS